MNKLALIIVTAAIVITGVTVVKPAIAPASTSGKLTDAEYDVIRSATEQYQDVQVAIAAGYKPTKSCRYQPGVGGQGYTYTNEALQNDGILDPAKPEGMVYERMANNYMQLVGVYYIVPDADKNLATVEPVRLFGKYVLPGPMNGHFPGQPMHYEVRAWLYNPGPGPNGMFEEFNPRVSCIFANRVTTTTAAGQPG